jgi:hypothetical protein
MTNKQKGKIINNIIIVLSAQAKLHNKSFDNGDTFFSLCFKTDKELVKIAKMCGIQA